MKQLITIIICLLVTTCAYAGTTFNNKEVLSSSKLNTAFAEKVNKTGDTMTGKLIIPSLNFNGVDLTVTGTELNRLSGVTSNVQTQLNNKFTSSYTVEPNVAAITYVNESGYFGIDVAAGNGVAGSDIAVTPTLVAIAANKLEIVTTVSTPANSSVACNAGEVRFDTNYMYRCVAANTWKRAALSTF